MERQIKEFPLTPLEAGKMKRKMLNWSQQFSIFLFFDSHEYALPYRSYECLVGAGAFMYVPDDHPEPLRALHDWHLAHRDWLFGHIAYDYKNRIEPFLFSEKPSRQSFPDILFFCPEVVCSISCDLSTLRIESITRSPAEIYRELLLAPDSFPAAPLPAATFHQQTSRQQYLSTVYRLKEHIRDGDCYEINYCCESHTCVPGIDPLSLYHHLSLLSPAPFAACYRWHDQYMACSSPERYLRKESNRVISQPIKGTIKRGATAEEDRKLADELRLSRKDQAENVMITDLVRNDLAASCMPGSIQVPELFGIYSFPQVHQMISTITGELRKNISFTEALRYSFPMGSMTGAPKIKVMQLTEQYEQARRGLYAGTTGYIRPDGDFDFNVIIRSLFYNSRTGTVSYHAGGAITSDSDPEKEWEEMRLKAWAMERIFQNRPLNEPFP